ncbi:MAG: adenylate/guanylate cyclase domain-containing protein [Bacteroidota bacterium]
MADTAKNKLKEILKNISLALLSAFVVILVTIIFPITPIQKLELELLDKRFEERGEIKIDSPKVVIVEISQESFDQIPPPNNEWPWPRNLFAKLINNLSNAGAKAIGIDIIMSDTDRLSTANDSLMTDAIIRSGKVVVAGKIDIEREALIQKLKSGGSDFRNFKEGTLYTEYEEGFRSIKQNFDNIFFEADSSIGIVQIEGDDDGIKRRYHPYNLFSLNDSESVKIPSFSFAVLNKYFNRDFNYAAVSEEDDFIYSQKKIPKFTGATLLINYYGGFKAFPYFKFYEVIDDSTFTSNDEIEYESGVDEWEIYKEEGTFKDKIVLIGSTMPEDKDIFPVSFSKGKSGDNMIPGVEIHATVIQNVLDDNFLYKQSPASEIVSIIAISLLMFFIVAFLKKIKFRFSYLLEITVLLLVIISIYGLYKLSVYFFINKNMVISVTAPSLAIIFGYITSTVYNYLSERRQNVLIKGMFSQYVNKSVVNELINNPDKLKLGGEKKMLTVLFSDIAGFTTFAERKPPEELVSFINEFLHEMTEIIIRHEGTLDKYLGDAVMAFWGAPIPVEEHAYKACVTSLEMQNKLAELRDKWSKTGEHQIRIRIGINSGEVIVGNIGGSKRFDYTVLGDDVNLASRLEGANKEYGSNIMISDATYELVRDKVLVRDLDVIRVKGKSEPTNVYELISTAGDQKAIAAIDEMHEYFQGLELYRLKSFDSAHDYFKRCYEKLGDFPSKVYKERCEYYLQNPPDKDWDGVFELKSK